MKVTLSQATAGRFLNFNLSLSVAKTLADTASPGAEVVWSSVMHFHLLTVDQPPSRLSRYSLPVKWI